MNEKRPPFCSCECCVRIHTAIGGKLGTSFKAFFCVRKVEASVGWEKPLPNPSSVEKGGEGKKTVQEFIIGPGGTVDMRKRRGEGEGCEDASQK